MRLLKSYSILQDQGWTKENAETFLNEILTDEGNNATKGDLARVQSSLKAEIGAEIKLAVSQMETKIEKELNRQTWKFLGGVGAIAALIKAIEFLAHIKGG